MRPALTLSFSPASLSFLKALTTLAAARRVLVAPGDAGHARRATSSSLSPHGVLLERLLDERVLDDLVLDARLAELVAELGDCLDVHPLEVEEDGRGHLVERALDRRRSTVCFLRSRVHELSPPRSSPTKLRRVDRTPGPIVELRA